MMYKVKNNLADISNSNLPKPPRAWNVNNNIFIHSKLQKMFKLPKNCNGLDKVIIRNCIGTHLVLIRTLPNSLF